MSLNVVEILVTAKNATAAGFEEAGASSAAMSRAVTRAGLIAAGGLAVVGVEATRMAVTFQSAMTQLTTQAGVPKAKLAGLQQGVLNLAAQVGFSPDSLAQSLFHVASNMESMGGTSKQMLDVVKTAAEGAKVGNADLVDVTNALTSAVASGIPGVKNYSQAMGMLNATVGTGDMTMQNLAEAFSTGLLPVMKQYGLTMKDVGAGLATFGDLNIRGTEAATKLRMAVQAMSVPSAQGKKDLVAMGMSANQLADDMRHGGLLAALQDLQRHYAKIGITGTKVGEQLTQDFGKKAGVGLSVLLGNMTRLESKYPALTKAAGDFGSAWGTAQQTLKQKLDDLRGGFDALMVTIGNKLIPVISSVVGWMLKHKQVTIDIIAAVGALAAALGVAAIAIKTIEIATKVWAGVQWLLNAALDANPIGLLVVGIAALVAGVIYAYKHFKVFRDVVKDVFNWIKDHWKLLLSILTGPIGAAVIFIIDHWKQIVAGAKRMWSDIVGFFKRLPGDILHALGNLGHLLWNAGIDVIKGLIGGIESMFGGLFHTIGSLASGIGHVFSSVLHIFSPSKVFDEHGRNIVRGLVQGINAEAPSAISAMRNLGIAGLPGGVGARGYGAGGGGAPTVILQLTGSGPFFEALKNEIRVRGGGGTNSVQVALGQNH